MPARSLLTREALDTDRGASGPVVDELQAYLSRFGWLRLTGGAPVVAAHLELPEASPGRFDDATAAALADFQRFYRLPVTGRLDAETLALIQRPRCGMPDRPVGPHSPGVDEFVASGTKWANPHVGYHMSQGTGDLSTGDVMGALGIAYRSWCLEAAIEVHAVASNPDIDVRFATGDHGDGNPFDGPGTILAHGFYPPPNGGAIAGDLHFDDAETWTRNLPPTGTDLDTVALHEAGHTLGLGHSADVNAVMYAYYGGPRRTLTADDIAGMRSLYGTRERNPWTDIDAAVDGQGPFAGKGYFFKGGSYLRYNYVEDLPDPGYPKSIGAEWHGMPSGVTSGLDAAANGQGPFAGKLYFFKGDRYVRYDWATDKTDPGYPAPIAGNWHGLPAEFTTGIDAAVSGQGPFAGKLYLFKGDRYVRYDWATDRMDPGYPLPIAGLWHGLPASFTSGIQAAMNGQAAFNGKLYFFKGADYVRYDWATDRMDPGYPAPIRFLWL